MRRILTIIVVALSLHLPGQAQDKTILKDGIWRGELSVADQHKAPFLFEVKNAATSSARVVLINGEERVDLVQSCHSFHLVVASFGFRLNISRTYARGQSRR